MDLTRNVNAVRDKIAAAAIAAGRDPGSVELCAATKVQSDDVIRSAIAAGIRLYGENRVQELAAHLEGDAYAGARVHFIGHLQTHKVKQVGGPVELSHSVDAERLLRAIDSQADRLGLVQDILLEVNVAGEESKGGVVPERLPALAEMALGCPHVRLRGLMAIPPVSTVSGGNRKYFAQMRHFLVDIIGKMSDNYSVMDCLSMGMSGDYEDAIAEGATLIRVGTALFGPRPPVAGPAH